MHYQLMHRHFLFCVGVGSRRFFVAMSVDGDKLPYYDEVQETQVLDLETALLCRR